MRLGVFEILKRSTGLSAKNFLKAKEGQKKEHGRELM